MEKLYGQYVEILLNKIKLARRSIRSFFRQITTDSISSIASAILKRDPHARQFVLRKILNDKLTSPISSNEIDSIVNFSSYWRDEWVAQQAALIPLGALVLDAGAGQGRYKSLFSHTRYHAQDFAQYKGDSDGPLRETWDYAPLDYVCDITDIPVGDNFFDVVICTEVLEHLPNPIAALQELSRVTKSGGKLIVTAPLGSGIHQEPYHFYGGFSPFFYQKYLTEFGFEINEIKPIGGLMRHVSQEIYRAANIIDNRGTLLNDEIRYVMKDWLPRLLSEVDQEYFINQFTVGYLVSAIKTKNSNEH